MKTIRIVCEKTEAPDLGGFNFYLAAGYPFDFDDYAEAYPLDTNDIDWQSVKASRRARIRPQGYAPANGSTYGMRL